MAITPYSTPLQYQYKPLNLMAFAEPLMKMQERFDLTKAALEEADVTATALQYGNDKERKAALENIYRGKRDELIQTLLETGNYSQVGSKFKQLNKLWAEDPERLALESNYKTFLERDKEELARIGVGEGKITKQQYLQWRADEIRKYSDAGGTNFRKDAKAPGGTTYNIITGTVGRTADMSKEMQELMFKTADAIQAKKYTGAMQMLGIDPSVGDAKFKITDYENLSRADIEAKVEEYIKQQDRFKPWLIEKADYDFKDIVYANDGGATYQKVAKSLITQNYNANEAYIKNAEKLKEEKSKDFNENKYQEALANRDFLLEQMSNPDQKVVRDLFVQNEMNRQYDASALGKIFEVNNSKTNYTFRDLPKDSSGAGSDFTLAGTVGRTSPTTKELVSTNLEANRNNAARDVKPHQLAFNNIADGKMRTLSFGVKGSELRKQIEANPAMAVPRQQQILAIFQQSKDAADFHRKLYNAGLAAGVGQDTTKEVFNALSNTKTAQVAATALEQMEEGYNKFVDADSQIQSINDAVLKDKKFVDFLDAKEDDKVSVGYTALEKLAKAWNTTPEKLIQSGVAGKVTATSGPYSVGGGTEYFLSGTNIAKAYGFKNLKDAVENGFNFSSTGATGLSLAINRARDEAAGRSLSGNEMGVRIVGDKIVDAAMKDELLNSSELTSFRPVQSKNWNNVPGFSEDGRMLAGTTLDGNVTPKLVMRANQVVMQIPYTYKNEDGKTVSASVEVKAKPGQERFFEKILRRTAMNNYQLKDEDNLANQTYNDAAVGLYNLMVNSNVTPQSAEMMEVNKTSRKAILETIKTGTPGTNIQLVKEYVEGGNPTYKAYVVSPAGSVPAGLEAGSVNALKVLITEQRFLQ